MSRVNDEEYLKSCYKVRFGVQLNLDNPQTFNEKMQWLKIHNRDERYTNLVDKCKVKEFIKESIGEKYLIPTIDVWDNPDKIDFDVLPNQFVLKCNHNSGLGMFICKDKNSINQRHIVSELKKGLRQDYYIINREWPYKNVQRRVIAEEYIKDPSNKDLKDYKVFVFNGVARFVQVDIDRFSNHKRNFYSREWEYVPFTTLYPTAPDVSIAKPEKLDELLTLSEKIAYDIGIPPFLRVDFYIVANQILFGEITFYHGGGNEQFYPEEYNRKLGDMIMLPNQSDD